MVAGASTIPAGEGHADSEGPRRKRRSMRMKRMRMWWPMWKKRHHKVMESRRLLEIVVGDFTDEAQSKSNKVL